MPGPRRWMTSALKLTAGLAAAVLVFEIAVRLVETTPLWRVLPVPEVSLFAPDEAAGYTHRAGATGIWTTENRVRIEINALGLRDRLDRTRDKPLGAMRWLVVGDSIVESLQVENEKTFPSLTEDRLTQQTGRRIEVVNLGLSGAVPAVVAERLRSQGLALSPDGVVVLISFADLMKDRPDNPSEFAGYVDDGRGGVRLSHAFRETRGYQIRMSAAGDVLYWLLDHSRLLLTLNNRKNQGFFRELAVAASGGPAAAETAPPDRCSEAEVAKAIAPFVPGSGFAAARVGAFLSDLSAISSAGDFPIVFAIRDVPDCSNEPLSVGLREAIRRRLDEFKIAFVDVSADVQGRIGQSISPRGLHGFGRRRGSGHLNEDGQRVYAEVLSGIIAPRLK